MAFDSAKIPRLNIQLLLFVSRCSSNQMAISGPSNATHSDFHRLWYGYGVRDSTDQRKWSSGSRPSSFIDAQKLVGTL